LKISYDEIVDAAYIRFLEGKFECTTHRLNEDVAVNITPEGRVVGIEVLDASKNLGVKKGKASVLLENMSAIPV
jgi:uncharacterized protein YuzE